MSHDFRDQAALFVVGALDAKEREAFVAHLRTCAECAAEVTALGEVATAMAQAVPQEAPPPQLRERILSTAAAHRPEATGHPAATIVRGAVPAEAVSAGVQHPAARAETDTQARRSSMAPWLAMAASIAVAVALGAYSLSLRSRVSDLEAQLQEAQNRVAESERLMASLVRASTVADSRLAVLTAPDMTRVALEGQPPAPQASGRAFWSRTRGLLLTASGVPPAPPGRTYQVWLVAGNVPISAGLITPDPDGNLTALFTSPDIQQQGVVVAMTLEPQGGMLSPTGDKYLVGVAN